MPILWARSPQTCVFEAYTQELAQRHLPCSHGRVDVVSDRNAYLVAKALFLDRAAAEAVAALDASGVESIFLKGAAIATWLYHPGEVRSYADVDLLVSARDYERATVVLCVLGYVHLLAGAHPGEVGPKERELLRPDGAKIDLHLGFVGVAGDDQRCWDILRRRVEPFVLAGANLRILDVPARAMHLALHAAQNGPIDVKALEDLRRGLQKLDESVWCEAAGIAQEIGATEAFRAGIRLLPGGEPLADRLALPRTMSVEMAIRVRSATQDAIFFERLRNASGLSGKVRMGMRKLFPTAVYLRANSRLANRGATGLLLKRMAHPFEILWRFGPAFVAWLRARRAVNS